MDGLQPISMNAAPEVLSKARVFHITSHSSLSSTVNILDLTTHLSPTFASLDASSDDQAAFEALEKEAKEISKTVAPMPYLSLAKQNFWATRFAVSSVSAARVADIKFPAWWGDGVITFNAPAVGAAQGPPRPTSSSSPHPPITVHPKSSMSREVDFVFDSVPYRWAMDSKWHSRRFTLYRSAAAAKEGDRSLICARAVQGWSAWTGATFIVDTDKIEVIVAVLTGLVTMRRIKETREAWTWS